MLPTPHKPTCDDHERRLREAEERLERGDVILKTVLRIETAVCGDEKMGVEGLASLPKRVQALERRYWWTLGACAAAGMALQLYQTFAR